MTAERVPVVWIIILNWNGLDDTLGCLASLQAAHSAGMQLQILVIDNNSDIDPRTAIAGRFPGVTTVRLDTNTGFAAGSNYGISQALAQQADYVLLLNNDTLVDPQFLPALLAALKTDPHIGIAAPLICYADAPERVWFAGTRVLLALGYFEHRYKQRLRTAVPARAIPAPYVSGCCMLIDTAVIRTIGVLDDRFFAYFEDAEFCLRARKQGFKAVCVPQSVIWHKESASTRRNLTEGSTSPLKHYLTTRNRIATVRRHGNLLEQIIFLTLSTPLRAGFYFAAFAIRKRWHKMVAFARGLADGYRGTWEHTRV